MKNTPMFLLLAALVGLPACGGDAAKKTDAKVDAKKAEPAADAKKTDDAKPAPAAVAFKKVDPLPLEIEVPADATVMDASADAPGASVMSGEWMINIATTTEAYPKDMAGAKKDIEMATKVKSFTKEAALDGGGWHLEYEGASITGNNVYGVEVRKVIDGKGYSCSRNDPNQANRDAIAKACLSLKKAG